MNKTGSHQCTRAVWSTFAEIHSTHPSALMHYSGLEFNFKVLVQSPEGKSRFQSASPEATQCLHRSENARGKLIAETFLYLSTPGLSITFDTFSACGSFETKVQRQQSAKSANQKKKHSPSPFYDSVTRAYATLRDRNTAEILLKYCWVLKYCCFPVFPDFFYAVIHPIETYIPPQF